MAVLGELVGKAGPHMTCYEASCNCCEVPVQCSFHLECDRRHLGGPDCGGQAEQSGFSGEQQGGLHGVS